MYEDNKHNLQFFEASSMQGLYALMNSWQSESRKRFLSVSIQVDRGMFCCIALTNPTEVVICDGNGQDQARVLTGSLSVCY